MKYMERMKITIPKANDIAVTARAVRMEGPWVSLVGSTVEGVARGKKMRKRRRLFDLEGRDQCQLMRSEGKGEAGQTSRAYITVKQDHCTPTWAIPSNPAKHEKPLMYLQQATSARLFGRTRIFAKAQVPDVAPSRTKYGEIPNDDRRLMIR